MSTLSRFLAISLIWLGLVGTIASLLTREVYAQMKPTNIGGEVDNFKIFNPQLGVYIGTLIELALIFGSIACLAYLLWGGLEWITSGGEQQKYQNARNKIMAAIIGLGALATSFLIWMLTLYFFGLKNSPLLQLPDFDRSSNEAVSKSTSELNNLKRLKEKEE